MKKIVPLALQDPVCFRLLLPRRLPPKVAFITPIHERVHSRLLDGIQPLKATRGLLQLNQIAQLHFEGLADGMNDPHINLPQRLRSYQAVQAFYVDRQVKTSSGSLQASVGRDGVPGRARSLRVT